MPTKMLDVASRIAQGIRTSANEIYVLDLVPDSIDGKIVKVTSKLFDSAFEIEQQITSSFLQGREIKPYSILSSGKVVIIPYNEENGRMRLISEEDMKRIYPRTYSYLLKNKNKLEEREHGKMKGKFWYAYLSKKFRGDEGTENTCP